MIYKLTSQDTCNINHSSRIIKLVFYKSKSPGKYFDESKKNISNIIDKCSFKKEEKYFCNIYW